MTALSTQDELYNLLNLLPERILQAIATQNRQNELLEIVLSGACPHCTLSRW